MNPGGGRDTFMKREETILIAHGGGGEMTRRLLEEKIVPRLSNPALDPLTDSAILDQQPGRLCFTTDAYVVQPLIFPGGDIGMLSVCGTVNDLAVMGARPLGISLALIIEEGLPLATFEKIIDSIASASRESGVPIITGDTKVVERRSGDGMFITTAGVGVLPDGIELSMSRIRAGDVIIVNGSIAEHGLAIMSAREGLKFTTEIRSDVAALNEMLEAVMGTGADVRFMRDMTRSGLAGVLADICEDTGLSVETDEDSIPVTRTCRHCAEMLGLDPLTVANEGKCLIVVPESDAGIVLNALKGNTFGRDAAVIGRTTDNSPALAELITTSGGRRIIQRPYGEELPRIC
jgi:hydrogenase expression/formation protein HypE